jgi:RNA polymerase sigma-70 factor (ECF subfamily)
LEEHRGHLMRYCRRILGSAFEAEDAVQETMLRGWRRIDQLRQRTSLRAWLCRIARNVCIDMMSAPQRRSLNWDLSPSSPAASTLPSPGSPDLSDVAVSSESVRVAITTAVATLPPRQRALLILHDVLCWKAKEIAELLTTTEAAVNSRLQRARATLSKSDRGVVETRRLRPDLHRRAVRYAAAFQRADVSTLVSLLGDEAAHAAAPSAAAS